MSERRTFRIRLVWPDGNTADFDVSEAQVYAWDEGPLEITTEHGLVIRTPLVDRDDDA